MMSQIYPLKSLSLDSPLLSKAVGVVSSSIGDLAISVISKIDSHLSSSAMKRLSEQIKENDRLGRQSHIKRMHHLLSLRLHAK